MTKKTQLIYIIGSAHSGSTLLSLILGEHSKIYNVGELAFLPEFLKLNRKCSCDSTITDCVFWNSIISSIGKKRLELIWAGAPFRNLTFFKKIILTLPFIKPTYIWKKRWINQYNEVNEQLINLIVKKNQHNIILDSSKGIYRAYLIGLNPNVECKFLYIYKDGRSILESHKRREINKNQYSFLREIFQLYKVKLIQIRFLNWLDPHKILFIDYNELAQNPSLLTKRILDFIDVKDQDIFIQSNGKQILKRKIGHNIGGVGIQTKEQIEIRNESKWELGLSTFEKVVFNLSCGDIIDKFFLKRCKKN